MLTAENIDELLEKAKAEERAYNWAHAAKIYERIVESFLDNKMVENAAKIYNKLREVYYWTGLSAENAKEYTESTRSAKVACKKGASLFREIKKKSEELECEAGIHFANGLLAEDIIEISEEFTKSYDLFIEASKTYSKENDVESHVRSLTYALSTLSYIISHNRDPKKIEQLYQKGIKLTDDIMSKDREHVLKYFSLMCFSRQLMGTAIWPIKDFKENYSLIKTFDEMLEIANYFEQNHKLSFRDLSLIYYYRGVHHGVFGYQYIEDEVEQGEYIDNAIKYFEKAMNFSRRSKIKPLLIHIIFWLDLWALFGGKIEYIQKRILNDIEEVVELGRIFEGSNDQSHYFAFLSPTFYYANMAQMSFLTQAQRISYAEKGIEYAKRSLKGFPPLITIVWSYQLLTWSYSVLAILIIEKPKRDEYIDKMFNSAEKANEIGEICEGGWAKASSLSSLYRAYKTLADITDTSEERIKMLSVAADIQKKYLSYSIESRSGTIAAHMRLGLLYEELGIIKKEDNSLIKAKKTFLEIIKESLERGYNSYAASAHEYLARVEDRLGNHTASAEHYEKAQIMHEKSITKIEYKKLKNRVKEKIAYNQAWTLIEQAKTSHRKEDHLKAREYYNKASVILENVLRYKYESIYYKAWALLEQAEKLSKEEKQEEAREKYNETKNYFENAIKSLKNGLKKSKEKLEIEQIKKLRNVAKLRMNYCLARIDLEKARIKGKRGDHLNAAEHFARAASQFKYVCTRFTIEREKKELEAVYYLCKAWESMELGENYNDPDRFTNAANLFAKASDIFTDSKLRLLSRGNSAFSQALEYGCKFDESSEIEYKSQLYSQVKLMLNKAAELYKEGGFKSGADWALATSTYFDAGWSLIKADGEIDINEKINLLGIGSRNLASAVKLFEKAGYRDKVKDIQAQLDMVKREEKIILSALNTVERPAISSSTTGILAPTCPIEISQSPRMSEIREIEAESKRVLIRRASVEKSKLDSKDKVEVKKDTL